ncbi:MAG: beta-lactamase family protein, partial [Rhodothermales bacterium]|nr:beta-lactamase family protein [Rhodothermales bacterium]
FTAAALAILIRRGSVALEDPVSLHIEEWPPQFSDVRVEHLVYMTSGLPEYYTLERPGGRDWSMDYFTVEDAITAVLAEPALEFSPGSHWAYSNTNYQVIAEIVARRSGQEFSDFVQREIFEPLGMVNSLVDDSLGRVIQGRATGYNESSSGYRQEIRRSPHYGGSGVFTTVQDLAVWIGSLESHKLGGPELTRLQLRVRQFDHAKVNDAFGLVWGEYRGHRIVWYEGGDLGFSSYMVWLPDEQLSLLVLSNLGTGQAATHGRAVLDILLGDD